METELENIKKMLHILLAFIILAIFLMFLPVTASISFFEDDLCGDCLDFINDTLADAVDTIVLAHC